MEAAGIFVLPQVGIEIDRCALRVNKASEIKRLHSSRENVNMNSFMLNILGGLDAAHFGEQMDNLPLPTNNAMDGAVRPCAVLQIRNTKQAEHSHCSIQNLQI